MVPHLGASHRCRALALAVALTLPAPAGAKGLRALIVGGGPTAEKNPATIEGNVRQVLSVLPSGPVTVLFADGDRRGRTVSHRSPRKERAASERALELALPDRPPHGAGEGLRKPRLPRLDGAARKPEIAAEFFRIKDLPGEASDPLFLYFAGHGSRSPSRDRDNSVFDLWGDSISVRELAAHVATLPATRSVVVVMVQCFSGAFGNLLFEGGHPAGKPVDRDLVGFFATVEDRMSAGCSLDERDDDDFTSYFFSALGGRDRRGRPMTGVDSDHDGHVGMSEAFAYALREAQSIDIPVATSDVFLRRFVKPREPVFQAPYARVLEWASPAQRAALEALSRALALEGEDRPEVADLRLRSEDALRRERLESAERRFAGVAHEARRALLTRWPNLKDPGSLGEAGVRRDVLRAIDRAVQDAPYRELLEADRALREAEREDSARTRASGARLARFVRLVESVVLAHALEQGGDEATRRRFVRLVAAESRPLSSLARE